MEQPVRSFASFMRTAPPHPAHPPPDSKLLPAIPSSRVEQTRTTSSRPLIPLHRTNSWKAPTEWDEPSPAGQKQDPQISSFYTPRSYNLLIPEPSPALPDDEDSNVWPLTSKSTQHSYLEPIDEQGSHGRSSSLYHSSYSSSLHLPAAEADCSLQNLSSAIDAAIVSPRAAIKHPTVSHNIDTEILSPLSLSDVMLHHAISETKQKAFASLDSESPVNIDEDPNFWPERSDLPRISDESHAMLSLLDKEPQPLNHGDLQLDDESYDSDLSKRLQQLGVSQDYHNVLADQYHEAQVDDSQSNTNNTEGRDPDFVNTIKSSDLVPRPLSWKKSPNGSSPGSSRSNLQADATSAAPDSSKRRRKKPSWVAFRQPSHSRSWSSRDEEPPRSAGDFAFDKRPDNLGPQKIRLLHKEIHLSHFIPQVKLLRSKTTGTEAPERSAPIILPSKSFPLEQSGPDSRLPGRLAIVRQTPAPISTSQIDSLLDLSPPVSTGQLGSYSDFPGIKVAPSAQRRSSLYSQQSDSPVAPAISINKTFRSSLGSPPTSPLAHEIEVPRTPPPPPRITKTLPTLSSWSQRDDGERENDRADSANEDEPQKRKLCIGILGKARDARETWKRHQRDAKHAKLKQSIRVLGSTERVFPTDYARRKVS
jgi:hypothetical protein